MKKLLLIFVITLCCKINLQAQTPVAATATLKGLVVDSVSKKPQDYITAVLKKENIGIKTALTEPNGTFTMSKVAVGKYDLVIVAMGFKAKTIPIDVKENIVYDLGKLIISAQDNNLNEVNITAAKPVIKQEIDRISYDMQADPESKVSTVLDMMRKIPLLSVDADDKIQLKGSGNYKILINGKPSSLVARNPSDVFKSMPAANIEKIEVITTPPAKYDSEGLAGIINIITKKNIDAGYNGSINLRESFPTGGPGGSGSITVKQGKFGISAYGGLSIYKSPLTPTGYIRTTTGAVPTSLLQNGENKYDGKFSYGSAELSYEIDTLNLITGEFSLNRSKDNNFGEQNSSLMQGGIPAQGYRLINSGDQLWKGIDLSVNYQLGFHSHKDRLLTFSYKMSNSTENSFSNQDIQNRLNYDPTTFPNFNQYNQGKSMEQTIQADYVHPLTKKLNLEGGLKAILRDNSSDFEFNNQNSAGQYIVDPLRSNNYDNHQNVYGLYNSYQYNLTNWGFKAGVRAELTTINADFVSQATNLDKDFINIIPTVSVNRKFKDMSSLNFGYTQRIERPGIWQLNPFVDRSNPNFESTGNPDLKPVLSNSFEMNYSRFKKGSINLGLSYAFANNTVQNVSVYNEATKITRSYFVNTGKDKKLGANININYPFTSTLNLTLGGNMNYVWLQGIVNGVEVKNDGLRGYVYGYLSYKLEKGWRFGGNFSYNSAWISLQGKSRSNFYTGFSGSKDLIKDKLTLSGSVNNPFNKLRTWENTTTGDNFTQRSYGQNYWRRFSTSLSWKFGKLTDGVKKNQRGISNDDVKGGGGGKG
ncbi:outer membrane beta-barrel family protein [Pedobacter duraquae]|uniref:Outer membrane receptor protein involved in Fe transport n=1 Tax=Pedobacter duraquae TaxID=425511 RepID=A0A4R6IIE9_9SPHI|nr:outer membrane beta-barrel family protein [Pedobacter duraquae]TDO21749.1 outer membrane receptor protein involved in Fe transport [Pedobacter duraquae]